MNDALASWKEYCVLNQDKRLGLSFNVLPLFFSSKTSGLSEEDYVDLVSTCVAHQSHDCLRVLLKFSAYERSAWCELVLNNDPSLLEKMMGFFSSQQTQRLRKGLSLSAKKQNHTMFRYLLGRFLDRPDLVEEALNHKDVTTPKRSKGDSLELSDGPFVISDAFNQRWYDEVCLLLEASVHWDSQMRAVEYGQAIVHCKTAEQAQTFFQLFKKSCPSCFWGLLHDAGPLVFHPQFNWVDEAEKVLGADFSNAFWFSQIAHQYVGLSKEKTLSDSKQVFDALLKLKNRPHGFFVLKQAFSSLGTPLLLGLSRESVRSDHPPGLFVNDLLEIMSAEQVQEAFEKEEKEFQSLLNECGRDSLFVHLNVLYEKWCLEKVSNLETKTPQKKRKI